MMIVTNSLAIRLASLGLSQAELRRWIEAVTGQKVAQSTTSRAGRNPWRDALLAVIEKPELIKELKRD
jgi:hypothetical protein